MLKIDKVHEDERGEIYSITGDTGPFEEFVILTTKKGFARGGCIHNLNNEYGIILSGEVDYQIGEYKHEKCKAGDRMFIKKGTPHYFYAQEDSIVMEFGATTEEKKEKHPEFRKLVDIINRRK